MAKKLTKKQPENITLHKNTQIANIVDEAIKSKMILPRTVTYNERQFSLTISVNKEDIATVFVGDSPKPIKGNVSSKELKSRLIAEISSKIDTKIPRVIDTQNLTEMRS